MTELVEYKESEEVDLESMALRYGPGSTETTLRPTVAAMEHHMHRKYAVLDHGFCCLRDYMGDQESVVNAARISYGRGTKTPSDNRNLIRYLIRHKHTTPLEMCEIKLHVKLPIFVARQWIRHRMASVNEYSARYSVLDKEFYIPKIEHIQPQSSDNKQGRKGGLTGEQAEAVQRMLRFDAEECYRDYESLLGNDERLPPEEFKDTEDGMPSPLLHPDYPGIARELARINLTLNTYTQFIWKIDLHNLLNFLHLRADPHAQYEIRAYAETLLCIVEDWVPIVMEAFQEYRLDAFTLSGSMIGAINERLAGHKVDPAGFGLSKREWAELVKVIPGLDS